MNLQTVDLSLPASFDAPFDGDGDVALSGDPCARRSADMLRPSLPSGLANTEPMAHGRHPPEPSRPFSNFSGREALEVTYDEFMSAVFDDLAPGAFVGSLRPFLVGDLSQLSSLEDPPLIQDVDQESDWHNLVPCSSFYIADQDPADDSLADCVARQEADCQNLVPWPSYYLRELDSRDDDDLADDADSTSADWEKQVAELLEDGTRDGPFAEREDTFAACHFVLVVGLGDAVPLERLGRLEPSWVLETGPGTFEAGFILAEPITDFAKARALIDAMINADLCLSDESGPWLFAHRPPMNPPASREMATEDDLYICRFIAWRPELRHTVAELVSGLNLELPHSAT